MYKKVIISVIFVIMATIGGIAIKHKEREDNTALDKDFTNEVLENEIKQEDIQNNTNQEIAESIDEQKENSLNNAEKPKEIQQSKKESQKTKQEKYQDSNKQIAKESTKNQNVPIENNNSNENNQEIVPEKNTQEEIIKESTSYNDIESQKMKADINTIAKENKDLWDINGNALYQVEIHKRAMNENFMYPYSIEQLKGKVLNVFPVKFVIYVIDYEKTGFQREIRHYIKIEQCSKK